MSTENFEKTLKEIDRFNSQDPRQKIVDGIAHPQELAYSKSLTEWVLKLDPQASEALRIAARGQQRGEQVRIDGCRADRAADQPHRPAHCIEESAAGIFHKVPAVGDLHRIGQGLLRRHPIGSAAVAGNDSDLRMAAEPGLRRRRLPVRKQSHDLPRLKVAHDGSVSVIAAPGPVVDADHP